MIILTISRTTSLPSSNAVDPFVLSYLFTWTTASWWSTIGGPADSAIESPSILEVLVNYNLYTEQSTYELCRTNESSWYYDTTAKQLFIHFGHETSIGSAIVQYGLGIGYSDNDIVYVDDTEYLPLVLSIPAISIKEDIRGYSKLAFFDGQIDIANNGGIKDELLDEAIIGNSANLAYIPDNLVVQNQASSSDVVPMRSYKVEKASFTPQGISISLQDRRKIEFKVPNTFLSASDFTFIKSQNIDKPIKLIYGQVYNVPAICTNSSQTGITTAQYSVGLTLTSISAVRLLIDDRWVVATYSADLANGLIVVNGARSAAGVEPYDCEVDCIGIPVTYASDIIKDIYTRYLNTFYNEQNFDIVNWEIEQVKLGPCGLVIESPTDVMKIINQVQNGIFPGFRFDISARGKLSIMADDDTKPIDWFVDPVEIADMQDISIIDDVDGIGASVTVLWKKNWNAGTYNRINVDTYSASVVDLYQIQNDVQIESLVTDLTQANAMAGALALQRSTPDREIKLDLLGDRFFSIKMYDIIQINTAQKSDAESFTRINKRDFAGQIVCKVIGYQTDYELKKVGVTLRLIKNRDPEYFDISAFTTIDGNTLFTDLVGNIFTGG